MGLTYDTSYAKMKEAMELLKTMPTLLTCIEEKVIVNFSEFGAYSMNITFIYYIKKEEDIPTAQSMTNLMIMEKFAELGLEFAFPTQTIYSKQG